MEEKTAMIAIEYILAGVEVLILVSIIANKVSGRLGIPALLYLFSQACLPVRKALAGSISMTPR